MIEQVKKIFDDHIRDTFGEKNLDICNYLLNHERKNICIEKVCDQIKLIERQNMVIGFDQAKWKMVIKSVADLFAGRCLEYAEQKAVSRLEKLRKQDEANYHAELEGEFAEMESEVLDEKPVSRLNGTTNKFPWEG